MALVGKGGKGGKGGKVAAGKSKKNPLSRTLKAGLSFPVGRIHRMLKKSVCANNRVGATSAVYFAAILEYLTAEVLELAGLICGNQSFKRITPRHICLAIKGDEELNNLIRATISQGGVFPVNESIKKAK